MTRDNPDHILLSNFGEFLNYFASFPKYYSIKCSMNPQFNLLTFKMLNKSQTGVLSLEEFFEVYKILEFKWKLKKEEDLNEDHKSCNYFRKVISDVVTSSFFEFFINLIIVINISLTIMEMSLLPLYESEITNNYEKVSNYIEWIFVGIYFLEMVFKILGLGKSS